jgi:uncharacterized membrane protein HdeD (DUF308 family)
MMPFLYNLAAFGLMAVSLLVLTIAIAIGVSGVLRLWIMSRRP